VVALLGFLYPRESFDFWEDPLGLSEYHVVALLGFYILGNILIPGEILSICQSTTNCVCTYLTLLHMMFQPRVDVDDVPTSCRCCCYLNIRVDDFVAPASCCDDDVVVDDVSASC
jgi:hypothetical protein